MRISLLLLFLVLAACQSNSARLERSYEVNDNELRSELSQVAFQCVPLTDLPLNDVMSGFDCYYSIWSRAVTRHAPADEQLLWSDYFWIQRAIAESVSRGETTFSAASFATDQAYVRVQAAIQRLRGSQLDRAKAIDAAQRERLGRTLMATGQYLSEASRSADSVASFQHSSPMGAGYLKGDKVTGFNRICYYGFRGDTYTTNVHSSITCPLRQTF